MTLNLIFFFLAAVSFSILINAVYNFITAPEFTDNEIELEDKGSISVLIPARNEERAIRQCLNSVLGQTYPNYEIIVYDDQSSDSTKKIVEEMMVEYGSKIKFISGGKLPEGWTGKNWACHNLSQKAIGEYFLFIDADVLINKKAAARALNLLVEKRLSFLSSFPTQLQQSLGEKLIVPLMNWLLLSFLPLKNIYTSATSSLLAANGQFILIPKNIYESTGGHKEVKSQVVEDMALARKVKDSSGKVMTLLGGDSIFCRMYENYSSAFNGFSKNFFLGFNTSPSVFLLLLFLFEIIFFLPFFLMFVNFKFIWIVIIILTSRILISWKSRQNIFWNTILHPVQMIILFAIGINSVRIFYSGKIFWKGRRI